jgi:hypothetical protein
MGSEIDLAVVETRSRARNTGHAFGFRGNLGLPFIVSVVVSIILFTMLMNGPGSFEMKIVGGWFPAAVTTLYLLVCRVGRPPNWDIDWVRTLTLGRGFKVARIQPVHPLISYAGK